MDKNMIHIDDLIKQRLGNGEEKERPGAWLQMRELLDKEMPVNPPAVFNWRRMLGLVAGVGLLASIGVGGYYYGQSLRADDINDTPVASVSSPGTNAPSNNNNDNTSSIAATGIEKENNTANTTNNNQTTDKKEATNQSKSLTNNDKENYTASVKSNKTTTAKAGTGATVATKPAAASQGQKTNQNQPSTNTNNYVAAKETLKANATEAQKTQLTINKPATEKTAATAGTTTAKEQLTAANTTRTTTNNATQPVVPNSTLANSNNTNKATNTPVKPADNTRSLAMKTDSMNKMNVVQRWDRKNGLSSDTVGTGKMAVDRMISDREKESAIAMKPGTAKAAESQSITPAASLAAKAEVKEGELVPLEKYRVARKKTNDTWDPNRFDEMVRDAKFKLSRVHFYPGILVGGNSTFGQNNLSGFHAGLSGIISFNEKWSVLTELKYMHRFHSGTIQDDYLRTTDSTKVVNGVRYNSYDSVEHFFNFPSASAVELPIALRYAIKRFQLFGGANMVYHFTINNVYEGDRLHPKETAMSSTVNYTWHKGLPGVTISDFSSRFGIGALLGAAYQMTPAMQIDLRLTQNVWDNARTPGAKAISRALYNVPSMQMTVTYRLSGNRPGPKKAQ